MTTENKRTPPPPVDKVAQAAQTFIKAIHESTPPGHADRKAPKWVHDLLDALWAAFFP